MDKFSLKSLLERGQEIEIGIIKEKAEKEVEQAIKKFKPDMFQVLLSCDVMRGSNCYSTNQLKLY